MRCGEVHAPREKGRCGPAFVPHAAAPALFCCSSGGSGRGSDPRRAPPPSQSPVSCPPSSLPSSLGSQGPQTYRHLRHDGRRQVLSILRQRPHLLHPRYRAWASAGDATGVVRWAVVGPQACPQEPQSFVVKDSPEGPTANRQPPPTANRQSPIANRQPLFYTASVVMCLAHVLTMKQRASP